MKKFDKYFFRKYLIEWDQMLLVVHKHIIEILDKYLFWMTFWVLIPSFLYYYSDNFKEIPFYMLEIWLFFVFIKMVYDIFDWYNDVWIVTNTGIIELNWSLFTNDVVSVKFEKIEWMQVEQYWFIDTLLNKWDLVIHKIWDDSFVLENAANPFKVVDEVGEIRKDEGEENFDNNMWYNSWMWWQDMWILANALKWVVWEYLEKKWIENSENIISNEAYKKAEAKKYIEKIEVEEGTLDLR